MTLRGAIVRGVFGTKEVAMLSADEVERLIGRDDVLIVDVNPERRWEAGHIPGAVNVDPAAFTAEDLGVSPETLVVFYCSDPGCGASPHAARRAVRMGFERVALMPAGIRGWVAAGKEVERA